MALISSTVFEVQTAGDDDNGGGFDSAAVGDDYTQGIAQETIAYTDLASTSASSWLELTSATRDFISGDIGNIVNIASGTNFTPGMYQITGIGGSSPVHAELDRACGSVGDASSGVGILGGALATYGMAGKVIEDHGVSGMSAFVKYDATPYAVTSASDNVSGGVVNFTSTSNSYTLVGYDTTRTVDNTDANRPTIEISGAVTPAAMLDMNNTADAETQYAANLIFDVLAQNCSGTVMVRGSSVAHAETVVRRIKCDAQSASSLRCFTALQAIECDARDATSGFVTMGTVSCYAAGCSFGFLQCANVGCVADACAVGFSLVIGTLGGIASVSCLAIACTGNGFKGDSNDGLVLINCVSVENTGAGYDKANGAMVLINCASGDNTGGRGDPTLDIGAITLPPDGDYFPGAVSGDFRPATSGDAANLLVAATFIQSSSLNATNDVGAVQHEDAGGGGMLVHPGTSGGARG